MQAAIGTAGIWAIINIDLTFDVVDGIFFEVQLYYGSTEVAIPWVEAPVSKFKPILLWDRIWNIRISVYRHLSYDRPSHMSK